MEYPINTGLTPAEINEMDDRREEKLKEYGIQENDVLARARDNLNIWNNYFNENVTRGKDDMNFVLRDQWTAIERSEFTRLFKPAMTFNKLYDATKKIAGEQRKNKPDLLVRSLTGKATQEQIDLRADLVRTISYQSQNDLVYQTAFKSALMMGYGAFKVDIEYETAKSFNQVIKYKLIADPTRTTFDPAAQKPHKGDGNYCSESHIFTKEEFAATYPYIVNPVSYADPRTLLDFQWETRDTIIVCDYYVKEWYSVLLYKLSNGMSVTSDEWDDMQKGFKLKKELAKSAQVVGGMILDEIPKIVSDRQSQDYRIMHYRLTKDKIIDFTEWPSKHLPIIFVDGDSYYIDGKQYTRSFIHEARDAQKFLNYVGSEIAAEIKNRRREQWLGTPDNIIGYEQDWRNPELQMGILRAKPDPKTGAMPVKQQPWDLSPQLMDNMMRAGQDIKEILGFNDDNQGNPSNAESGVAVMNRQLAGSMSAYVFFDNLNQGIEQAGRVVLDLLPVVYGNDERHVTLSKTNGDTPSIVLNKKMPDGSMENELSAGEFDIEIDTGPSFAVQKQVALEFLANTIKVFPQAFPLVADLWVKNLDVQFMPQMAERFKTLVPPNILAKEEGKPAPPPKTDPQQQMMQMEQQAKMQEMQNRAQEIQLKSQQQELEKQRLMMDMQKMQDEMQTNKTDHMIDMKETELDYHAKMAKIFADLHKHSNPHESKST